MSGLTCDVIRASARLRLLLTNRVAPLCNGKHSYFEMMRLNSWGLAVQTGSNTFFLRQKFQDGPCSQEFFMFIKIRGTFHVCIVYIYFSFKRIRSSVSLILLNLIHRLSPILQLVAATVKISSQDAY